MIPGKTTTPEISTSISGNNLNERKKMRLTEIAKIRTKAEMKSMAASTASNLLQKYSVDELWVLLKRFEDFISDLKSEIEYPAFQRIQDKVMQNQHQPILLLGQEVTFRDGKPNWKYSPDLEKREIDLKLQMDELKHLQRAEQSSGKAQVIDFQKSSIVVSWRKAG